MLAIVSLIASVLATPPASAAPGADSPDGAVPLICGDGDVVEDLGFPDHKYAAVWVPAGGTLHFRTSGTLYMTPYYFGTWVAQFYTHFRLWSNKTLVYDRFGNMSAGASPSPAPVTQDGADPYPFTNNTGVSQVFGLELWAEETLTTGQGIEWQVALDASGGVPAACSDVVDGSELFGPNPALGQQCPRCHGGTSNSVDTNSGNEHFSLPGVSVEGRGPGLDFQLAHNSLDAGYAGPLGHGWRSSYDMALSTERSGTRSVFQETGATVPFTKTSSGTWVAPPRFDATLTAKANGEWEFVRGRAETFTFRSDGRLSRISDRNGYETNLVYTNGDLDYVEDEAGRRLDFTWSGGRMTQIADPRSSPGPRKVQMDYNAAGDLDSYRDIGGGDWTMTYDAQHRLTTVRSPRFKDATANPNKVWEYHYDSQGRVDWEEDPQDRRTEVHYDDPQAGATRVVEPDGDARVDWYDASGMLTAVTIGYGSTDATKTTFAYDSSTNMLKSTTDGRGKVWTTQYTDPVNPLRATTTTDPVGRTRSMTYDSFGQILTLTDAEGATTKWEYDTHGNLDKTTEALGTASAAVTDLVYGDASHPGDVTKTIDPRGKTWTYTYDATTGDRTSATDPLGNKTTWAYNNLGWLTSTFSPKGNATGADPANFRSTIEYDAYGAPVRTADADGNAIVLEYDADGHVITETDPAGHVTRRTWTAAGQLATDVDGAGTAAERTVTYQYAADGRMASWSADPASVWKTTWDAVGRMKSQTDPAGKVTQYTYDKSGSVVAVTQPGGSCGTTKSKCISYTRDDTGLATKIDFSDAATPDVDYTYDRNGHRLTETVAGQGISRWTWTPRGQLASHTDAAGEQVSYAWDSAGNLARLTYPGQTVPVTYGYDAAGRMNSVSDWTGNQTQFSYDANSNLTQSTYPADTGLVDTASYDNLDRIDAITWGAASGGNTLGSIDYTEDPEGFVTGTTTVGLPGNNDGFSYDPRDQLKSATGGNGAGQFDYDDRGYLTRSPDAFNAFDASGELTESRRAIRVIGTAKTSNALSNTLNLTLPTSIAAKDQILLVATLPAAQSVTTPPAGFAKIAEDSRASGGHMVVYRKTAVGDETSLAIKFSGGNKSAMAIVYRGVDAQNPVAATTTATANDTSSLTVPGLSAPGVGTQLVLATGGMNSLLGVKTTPPAGMSKQVEVGDQTQVASAVADQTLTTAGPTGEETATFSLATDAVATLIALNPEISTHAYDSLGNRTATTRPDGMTSYGYDQAGRLASVDGRGGFAYDGDGLRNQAPISGQDKHFTWARAPEVPELLMESPLTSTGQVDRQHASSYVYGPGGRVLTRIDPRPQIERVGTTSVADAGVLTGAITLPLPDGIKADDQILVGVAHNNAASPTLPAGYTEVGIRSLGPTVLRLWRHTATDDEAASLKITFSSSLLAPKSAVAMVYRGVDPDDPIVDLDGGTGQGTTVSIPSLDPGSKDNHVAAVAGSTATVLTATDWTPPAGFTEREQASATGISVTAADRDTDAAAATGPIDFSFNSSSNLAALGVVLRQAPPPERWYHADALGSTRILTDGRARVVGKTSYTPYGQVAESTGEVSRFGFAGEYTDPGTGLVYLRARYYDPSTSQFLTRDPLLEATQDPYGYSGNNPVNATDPTGMCPFCIAVIGGAVIGGGMDLGGQIIGNLLAGCSAFHDINWGSVGRSALEGGLEGALGAGAALGGARLLGGGSGAVRAFIGERRAGLASERGAVGWGRGGQKLSPDPAAGGYAHSTFRRGADGRVSHYVEWTPNQRSPRGYDVVKRYDGVGGSHYDKLTGARIPTPHVQGPWGVRPAQDWEIPR